MKSYLNTFLGQIANRSESELNLAKRAFEAGWMARAVDDSARVQSDSVSVPEPKPASEPVSEPVSELAPILTPEQPVSEPAQPVILAGEPVSEPVITVAPAESAAPIEPETPVVN